ncbi:hypothetical protein [Capnocytophaga sputigena]|uniref:hypothetical protein n=1 Tax=Capnocytophaga sputigena TaxID=1019 RepID=UPI0028D62263|nr:hypothetical protein [Capnocytophaga sputigena]
MKVILIQGAENTGKTTLCNNIDYYFKKQLKARVVRKQILSNGDFWKEYSIKIGGKKVRVIINSFSDDTKVIKNFKNNFYKSNIDVLITAIRPMGDKNHNAVKQIYQKDLTGKEEIIDLDNNLLGLLNQLQGML